MEISTHTLGKAVRMQSGWFTRAIAHIRVSEGTGKRNSQVLGAVGTKSSSAGNETAVPRTEPGLSCISNLEEAQLACWLPTYSAPQRDTCQVQCLKLYTEPALNPPSLGKCTQLNQKCHSYSINEARHPFTKVKSTQNHRVLEKIRNKNKRQNKMNTDNAGRNRILYLKAEKLGFYFFFLKI